MSKSELAKLTVAVILGMLTSFFWQSGLEKMAIFVMATMLFQIFFVTAEKKNQIEYTQDKSHFAKEMKNFKKHNLF